MILIYALLGMWFYEYKYYVVLNYFIYCVCIGKLRYDIVLMRWFILFMNKKYVIYRLMYLLSCYSNIFIVLWGYINICISYWVRMVSEIVKCNGEDIY